MSVINMTNLKKYLQNEKSWPPEGLLTIELPIAYLRYPLGKWEDDSCLEKAIELTVEKLKSWQAFRSSVKGRAEETEEQVIEKLPGIVLDFQRKLETLVEPESFPIETNDINSIESQDVYNKTIEFLVETVYQISLLKGNEDTNPMLGSKVLHFLFPELFPVWDNAVIAKLLKEKCSKRLGDWYPEKLQKNIRKYGYNWECYGWYLTAMFKDTSESENIESIAELYVKKSSIPDRLVSEVLPDLSTFLMEACLIGTKY